MISNKKIDKPKIKNFTDILEEVKVEVINNPKELFSIVTTLNQRIPYETAIKSLSVFQWEFKSLLEEKKFDFITDINKYNFDFKVGVTHYGRLLIQDKLNLEKNDMFIVIGYIKLKEDDLISLKENFSIKAFEIEKECNAIRNLFNQYENETINNILDTIYFEIYHMAPLLIYTNEDTYSTFYQSNNLIEPLGGGSKSYLLHELKNKKLSKWKNSEVLFIYSMYWLIKSGNGFRAEEFNGKQLTPYHLNEFFDNKITKYVNALNIHEKNEVIDIEQKSKYVSRLRKQMELNYKFYRNINGLNLSKEENFISNKLIKSNSDYLEKFIQDKYSIDFSSYPSIYKGFKDLILKVRQNPCQDSTMSPIEEIFHDIVYCAVKITNADLGMTRGVKNLNEFISLLETKNYDKLCEWKQSDFFTCVVPSFKMTEKFSNNNKLLTGILKSVSARMQYNGWHYLPGNFPLKNVPYDRHFYTPPVMPDTTVWSNQHHKGHVFVNVKYAIRIPEQLVYKSDGFKAFTDLRLMKQGGEPFTPEELKTSLKFSYYIKQYYQALIDSVKENNIKVYIEAFDKKWYDKNYN